MDDVVERPGVLQAFYNQERSNNIHLACWFRVRNGVPNILHDNSRGFDRVMSTYNKIRRVYALPDWRELGAPENGDFCLFSDDVPPEDAPVLAYCSGKTSDAITVPGPNIMGWPADGVPAIDTWSAKWLAERDIPFQERKDIMFWRGYGIGHRMAIVNAIKHSPHVDVAPSPPFIPMFEQNSYKYILDMRGIGWSARLAQLVWMGVVIFVADRPSHERWFWDDFEPWVHYVPVPEDGQRILEILQEVMNRPDKGESIARACRARAAEIMTEDYVVRLTGKALGKYARRYGTLDS